MKRKWNTIILRVLPVLLAVIAIEIELEDITGKIWW
jgi:hypothetical protein